MKRIHFSSGEPKKHDKKQESDDKICYEHNKYGIKYVQQTGIAL